MITILREKSSAPYEEVDEGQFFLYNEHLYLKTPLLEECNAYGLEESGFACFDEYDEVIPVDVKITIL